MKDELKRFTFSQTLVALGVLMAELGVTATIVAGATWLLLAAIGVVFVLLGFPMMRRQLSNNATTRAAARSTSGEKAATIRTVMQQNVPKMIFGMSLCVAGMLMFGIGLIAGFADSDWFYGSLIGAASLVIGAMLLQSEVRSLIAGLRRSSK